MLFKLSLLVIFAATPLVFATLYFFRAPYGRHYHGGWGPTVSARAGWLLMELPALVVIALCVFLARTEVSLLSFLLLGLWEVHYLYRTCLFPFLIRDRGKQFPIVIILFAAIFNSLNGYANGVSLASASPIPAPGFLPGLRFVVGVALFAAGFVTHVWADRDLRALRRPGEVGYQIPRGGPVRPRGEPQLLRRDRPVDRAGRWPPGRCPGSPSPCSRPPTSCRGRTLTGSGTSRPSRSILASASASSRSCTDGRRARRAGRAPRHTPEEAQDARDPLFRRLQHVGLLPRGAMAVSRATCAGRASCRPRWATAHRVIEEGLNGRTTVWDDPIEGDKNGLRQLPRSSSRTRPWTSWC